MSVTVGDILYRYEKGEPTPDGWHCHPTFFQVERTTTASAYLKMVEATSGESERTWTVASRVPLSVEKEEKVRFKDLERDKGEWHKWDEGDVEQTFETKDYIESDGRETDPWCVWLTWCSTMMDKTDPFFQKKCADLCKRADLLPLGTGFQNIFTSSF